MDVKVKMDLKTTKFGRANGKKCCFLDFLCCNLQYLVLFPDPDTHLEKLSATI